MNTRQQARARYVAALRRQRLQDGPDDTDWILGRIAAVKETLVDLQSTIASIEFPGGWSRVIRDACERRALATVHDVAEDLDRNPGGLKAVLRAHPGAFAALQGQIAALTAEPLEDAEDADEEPDPQPEQEPTPAGRELEQEAEAEPVQHALVAGAESANARAAKAKAREAEALALIAAGESDAGTCRKMGVGKTWITMRKQHHPAFAAAVAAAKAKAPASAPVRSSRSAKAEAATSDALKLLRLGHRPGEVSARLGKKSSWLGNYAARHPEWGKLYLDALEQGRQRRAAAKATETRAKKAGRLPPTEIAALPQPDNPGRNSPPGVSMRELEDHIESLQRDLARQREYAQRDEGALAVAAREIERLQEIASRELARAARLQAELEAARNAPAMPGHPALHALVGALPAAPDAKARVAMLKAVAHALDLIHGEQGHVSIVWTRT